MKEIIDNFSERAETYAKFRPVYPLSLYQFIYSQVENYENALDCGTGNGQAALELSKKFKNVYATDISNSQLVLAPVKSNIYYSNQRAEKTSFKENSFDLITVAQAIHWFDRDAFYREVLRISKSNAIVAVWGYNLLHTEPAINRIIAELYSNILGKYWDADRRKVEESYKTITFPFDEIISPYFEITTEWDYEQLTGYLNSWSAVVKFQKEHNSNPIGIIQTKLRKVWGDNKTYDVKFPLFLRIGRVKYKEN